MHIEEKGARLIDDTIAQYIIPFHDECCAHSSELCSKKWAMDGNGSQPGKDKNPWWDGEQTQEQAKRHLIKVDA
jgi:hypothetical protein